MGVQDVIHVECQYSPSGGYGERKAKTSSQKSRLVIQRRHSDTKCYITRCHHFHMKSSYVCLEETQLNVNILASQVEVVIVDVIVGRNGAGYFHNRSTDRLVHFIRNMTAFLDGTSRVSHNGA